MAIVTANETDNAEMQASAPQSTAARRVRPPSRQAEPRQMQAAVIAIRKLGRLDESRAKYFRRAVQVIVSHFGGLYGSIIVRSGAKTFSEEYRTDDLDVDAMMTMVEALGLEAQADDRSIARRFEAGEGEAVCVAISTPIHDSHGELAGSLVVCLPQSDNDFVKQAAGELAELVDELNVDGSSDSETGSGDEQSPVAEAILRVARYSSAEEMAFALVNSLAQKMDCSQVAMGRIEGEQVELVAVSGIAQMSINSPGLVDLRQAMDECLDRGELILVQQTHESGAADSDNHMLHGHWHRETAFSPVMSIPLMVEDQVTGVISLRRDSSKPFLDQDVERAKATLAPFGPAIDLLAKARQSTWERVLQSWRDLRRSIAKPKSRARRMTNLGILLGVLFFAFGAMPFRMSVPCTIESAGSRQIAAPFDGMLSEVLVRPGDQVKLGQVLARFDTRELMIERKTIMAEIKMAQVELNRAIVNGDTASASVARAELHVLDVRRSALDEKINMAEIRAAADGTVIRGDLITEIGAMKVMGTPLMQLAPNDGWFVQLTVPDNMATRVEAGQTGRIACMSRPGDRYNIKISRVVPSAEVVNGKNVFMAEADVEGQEAWMRAGMEGVARIDAGWEPVWWVALHRFVDPIRMGAW